MSCFFCSSNDHVTHNCDVYKTDDQRREILRQKKLCTYCLSTTNNPTSLSNCINCYSNEKCFICFSKDHHTVFCPDRFTGSHLFLPKIDKTLVPRFFQFLSDDEKQLLFLLSPVDFGFLKPLKVIFQREMTALSIRNVLNADIVVAERARIQINPNFQLFPNESATGSIGLSNIGPITFHIKDLVIHQSPFSSPEFLLLLSPKTKVLKCGNINFLQKLTCREILRKASNLKEIDIHETNVIIENSWPGDLLKLNTAAEIEYIHLKIDADFVFNVESLATLMKKKCNNIVLTIVLPPNTSADQIAKDKLSMYFDPYVFKKSKSLTILYVDSDAWFKRNKKEVYGVKNSEKSSF